MSGRVRWLRMSRANQGSQPTGDGDTAGDIARLHLWELQAVRDVAVIAAVIGLVYVGYLMRVVMTPVLVGLALAYLFEPVVRRLARRTGRTWASGIVVVGMVIGIGVPLIGAAGLATVQTVRATGELRANWPEIRRQIEETLERLDRAQSSLTGAEVGRAFASLESDPEEGAGPPEERASGAPVNEQGAAPPAGAPPAGSEPKGAEGETKSVLDRLEALIVKNPGQVGKTIAGGGRSAVVAGWAFATSAGTMIFMAFFLTPFFFFFWSVGLGGAYSLGHSLIPEKNRDRTVRIAKKMDRAISGFVRGRITISAILAVLFTIGYWAIGVPAPVVIGVLTGLLAIVPYLALLSWPTAIGALWVSELGSQEPMAWWLILLLPTLVYWGIQTIDDYVLTPIIQGKETGLDTPTIMVAVLGAGALAGVYGVLLAIPAAACLKILAVEVFWPRYRAWAEGNAPDPLPIGESANETKPKRPRPE